MIRELENQEDTVLLNKFLLGDDEAYAYFYQKYVRMLFSYGMRFTSDSELVKDCIQDVFVKLYNKRSNLKHVNHIQAYLFIALKNELYTYFQKDKSLYHIDVIEPIFSIDYTTEEYLIAKEEEIEAQNRIRQILDTLTPRQKEVIYYRYIQGMELNAICKLMQINYQSLQNLLQRSIQKVKKTFEETNHTVKQVKKQMNIIKRG